MDTLEAKPGRLHFRASLDHRAEHGNGEPPVLSEVSRRVWCRFENRQASETQPFLLVLLVSLGQGRQDAEYRSSSSSSSSSSRSSFSAFTLLGAALWDPNRDNVLLPQTAFRRPSRRGGGSLRRLLEYCTVSWCRLLQASLSTHTAVPLLTPLPLPLALPQLLPDQACT